MLLCNSIACRNTKQFCNSLVPFCGPKRVEVAFPHMSIVMQIKLFMEGNLVPEKLLRTGTLFKGCRHGEGGSEHQPNKIGKQHLTSRKVDEKMSPQHLVLAP